MEDLGKSDVDFDNLFKGLEKKYIVAYHEKFKTINEKNNNLMKKAREKVITNVIVQELSKQNNITKETQKTATAQTENTVVKEVQTVEKQEQKQVEAKKATVKSTIDKVEKTK